jgi:hypothetical protein
VGLKELAKAIIRRTKRKVAYKLDPQVFSG